MQDLQGLLLSDFEKKGLIILGKAEVDKDGTGNFVELEDVKSFDVQSTITNLFLKTCAKSFSIELLNTGDRYSFFDRGRSQYNWIREGRRIRLYVGIQREVEVESTEYSASQENEISVSGVEEDISAINYCDSDDWWGYWDHPVVGTCCSGNKWVAMLRMLNLQVPQGAIIDSAVFEANGYKWACDGSTEDIKIEIQAEKTTNAEQIDSQEDHESRELTTAKLEQTIPYSAANVRTSFDITDIIQEIVNQEGWESGNAINLHFAPQNENPIGLGWDFDFSTQYGRDASLTVIYRTFIATTNNENREFHWSWVHGIIDKATTQYSSGSETCSISGRDYIAYLSENYLKKLWWGKNKRYSVISGKEKYDMEEDCKGIHNAFIDWSGTRQNFKPMTFNSEYTYDWTTNQLVFLLPQVPGIGGSNCLWVYYYTPQKVEDVVADLLIEAGILTHSHKQAWLNSGRVTPTNLYIDRCYFNSNTTYLHAIELLSEVALYNFYIDGEGVPCFKQIPPTLPELVVRLNSNEYMVRNMEERLDELYNHFIIQGERREMKVKDLSLELYQNPVVTTSTAVLKAAILDNGGNAITQRGFIWKKGEEAEQSWYASGEYSGLFTHMISGLMPDTEYKFCAFARTAKQYKQTVWSYFKTESEE